MLMSSSHALPLLFPIVVSADDRVGGVDCSQTDLCDDVIMMS